MFYISYKLSLISHIATPNVDNGDCRYGKDYEYPTWAEALGLMMSLSSMVMVPGYAVYYVLCQPGTIVQNIRQGLKPNLTLRREVSRTFDSGPSMGK